LDEAKHLFNLAQKYEVNNINMESACEQFILKNIKKFNLPDLIQFGDMFSMKHLVELCRLVSVNFFLYVNTY